MRQGNEVGVLAEAIDDDEDHRFAAHAKQSFDEVHPNVGPDRRRYGQRKEQSCRMQMLGLVALTGGARLDEVLDHPPEIR